MFSFVGVDLFGSYCAVIGKILLLSRFLIFPRSDEGLAGAQDFGGNDG